MSNSEKILKTISSFIEEGILTSKDIRKELSTDLKFKKDKIISKLDLVSREEFEVLKRIVQKQHLIIKKLQKHKKTKKVKKFYLLNLWLYFDLIEYFPRENL